MYGIKVKRSLPPVLSHDVHMKKERRKEREKGRRKERKKERKKEDNDF